MIPSVMTVKGGQSPKRSDGEQSEEFGCNKVDLGKEINSMGRVRVLTCPESKKKARRCVTNCFLKREGKRLNPE